MDQGVIASVPLGLIVIIALALLALGIVIGWLGTRSRLLRKSKRVLSNHAFQVSAFLDALPQAALTTDNESQITAQNALANKMNKDLNWKDELPVMLDAAAGRVIRSRVPETFEITTSVKPARRVQVTVAPLHLGGQQVEALVLFNDQNTGSNRAEVYQRLIGTVAHELRTPLTAITGHVEILNSCQIDEEALWRRSLGFVSAETERMTRLVEDFLSLSRLDRMSLHRRPVNLRVSAEEAISSLYDAAEQNKVTPIIQAPIEVPPVLADPDRIKQVFINLLDNSIKYAPGSNVTVRLTPEDEIVKVEISDNGPGIPAEDLPYIFEPFRRGKQTAARSKGTGLGLTIIRTILEQHQAPISVKSEVGIGTTFTFSLATSQSSRTKET